MLPPADGVGPSSADADWNREVMDVDRPGTPIQGAQPDRRTAVVRRTPGKRPGIGDSTPPCSAMPFQWPPPWPNSAPRHHSGDRKAAGVVGGTSKVPHALDGSCCWEAGQVRRAAEPSRESPGISFGPSARARVLARGGGGAFSASALAMVWRPRAREVRPGRQVARAIGALEFGLEGGDPAKAVSQVLADPKAPRPGPAARQGLSHLVRHGERPHGPQPMARAGLLDLVVENRVYVAVGCCGFAFPCARPALGNLGLGRRSGWGRFLGAWCPAHSPRRSCRKSVGRPPPSPPSRRPLENGARLVRRSSRRWWLPRRWWCCCRRTAPFSLRA